MKSFQHCRLLPTFPLGFISKNICCAPNTWSLHWQQLQGEQNAILHSKLAWITLTTTWSATASERKSARRPTISPHCSGWHFHPPPPPHPPTALPIQTAVNHRQTHGTLWVHPPGSPRHSNHSVWNGVSLSRIHSHTTTTPSATSHIHNHTATTLCATVYPAQNSRLHTHSNHSSCNRVSCPIFTNTQ